MADYQFSVILEAEPLSESEILDATDLLGDAGCTDASILGHAEGVELLFARAGDSLQAAISSAITDVERAGFRVARIELERDAVLETAKVHDARPKGLRLNDRVDV